MAHLRPCCWCRHRGSVRDVVMYKVVVVVVVVVVVAVVIVVV
jgi:hypothetical protein